MTQQPALGGTEPALRFIRQIGSDFPDPPARASRPAAPTVLRAHPVPPDLLAHHDRYALSDRRLCYDRETRVLTITHPLRAWRISTCLRARSALELTAGECNQLERSGDGERLAWRPLRRVA